REDIQRRPSRARDRGGLPAGARGVTRFTLLGVPIDPVTEAEAVDWVARALGAGRPRVVISVNPERIMHAQRDPAFAAVLAGTYAGSPDPAGDPTATAAVRSSGAQILFLAYGASAEEAWLARNLVRSGASVGMGVGGAFDFISGRVRRAPPWMRQRGLEWL